MRTAAKDRGNNPTEEPPGRPGAGRWRAEAAGVLPCCRLILGAGARPAPSPVAGSAPAPQCARAPAVSGSGPPVGGGGGEREGRGHRERKPEEERGKERERGGVIYHEQDRKTGRGEEVAEGKRGGLVRWACLLPSCPGWVSLRAPGVPLSPPGGPPLCSSGEEPSLLPFPTGTQAQDPAHSPQDGGRVNDPRIPGPQEPTPPWFSQPGLPPPITSPGCRCPTPGPCREGQSPESTRAFLSQPHNSHFTR